MTDNEEYTKLFHQIKQGWESNPASLFTGPWKDAILCQYIKSNAVHISRLGELHRKLGIDKYEV